MLSMLKHWFNSCENEAHQIRDKEDSIISCARNIINNGFLLQDNASERSLPSVTFKDDKGNTLYICWYNKALSEVKDVIINDAIVPRDYDRVIFKIAQERIDVLRKEHLEKMIKSIK